MLKYLDGKVKKTSTGSSAQPNVQTAGANTKGQNHLSPTLQRYANVVGRKRNLSQYLEDERKGKSTVLPGGQSAVVGRGTVPLYNTAANTVATAQTEQKLLPIEKDHKKAFFKAFEHPFVLINETSFRFAPVFKEYGPEAMKTSKSGQPWPVLHWQCPFGYCPFIQPPPSSAVAAACAGNKTCRISRGITTRSKAASLATAESGLASKLALKRSGAMENLDLNNTAIAESKPTTTMIMTQKPKQRSTMMNLNRARPGYCECCYERYSDLSKHVSSLFHRQFALEDKNYASLDRLLQQLSRDPITKPTVMEPELLLRSPVSQKSTNGLCAPDLGNNISNNSNQQLPQSQRNYTASKRAKQTQALRAFKPQMQNDENTFEQVPSSAIPSSPSCKRRRSTRVQELLPIPQLEC